MIAKITCYSYNSELWETTIFAPTADVFDSIKEKYPSVYIEFLSLPRDISKWNCYINPEIKLVVEDIDTEELPSFIEKLVDTVEN